MSVGRAALCILVAAASLVCFIMMGVDKARAKRGAYRIRERTLLLCAACFGSLGGMAGMLVFRHKTRHAAFAVGLPVMLCAQVVLGVWAWQSFWG